MIQQFLTAITASFGLTLSGIVYTWPSYTQDILTANDTTVLSRPLSGLEVSLFGSIPSLGAMLGTAVVGYITGNFGKRRGGLLITLPAIIGWTMIELTSSPTVLLVSRFLLGVTGGSRLAFAPMFISDTAQDSIRGMLASGPTVFYCLGALSSYLMGWFLGYHTIVRIMITISVIAAVTCMLVVESPVFLMSQNNEEEARRALAKYRGLSPTSKIVNEEISRLRVLLIPAAELQIIKATDPDEEKNPLKSEKEIMKFILEDTNKMSPVKALFISPTSRRAYVVVCITGVCQVFMGMPAIQVYAKKLFKQAAPDLSSNFCSVLLAVVLLAGGMVTAGIADKAGRRVLLMSSSAMVGTSLFTMAILIQTSIAPAWVTAVMVLVYSFSFYCGAGSVPYVLLAELFTSEVQAVASMIFVEFMWFLNFLIIAIYPGLIALLGISAVFAVFGSIALANAVFSFFMVPETKGLNKLEIQEKLAKGMI